MELITLEEAKAHLQVDYDDDDVEISNKLQEATSAVLTYLNGAPIGQPERDEQGAVVRDEEGEIVYLRDGDDLVVRYEIKAAVKLMLGELYKHREAEQDGEVPSQYGYGYLPRPVVGLLFPLRRMPLA